MYQNQFILIKYLDNKCVIAGSTRYGLEPKSSLSRWCDKEKKKNNIPCPNIIKKYNENMGGILKNNALVSLYTTSFKSRRWYLPIFFYLLEMCVINACLLYRKENKVNHYIKLPKSAKKLLSLKEFRTEIIKSLFQSGKKVAGRRRHSVLTISNNTRILKPRKEVPTEDVRFDSIDHFPAFSKFRQRCTLCIKNKPLSFCVKCNVYLCCNKNKNCFLHNT